MSGHNFYERFWKTKTYIPTSPHFSVSYWKFYKEGTVIGQQTYLRRYKSQKPFWKAGNQIFSVYFGQFPCFWIRIQDSQISADPCRSGSTTLDGDHFCFTYYLFHVFFTITGMGRHTTSCCSMDQRWADELPTGTRHKISTVYLISILIYILSFYSCAKPPCLPRCLPKYVSVLIHCVNSRNRERYLFLL